MEKVVIGNATLYCGDAIEILPTLKADLIVTDPPYKLTSGGGTPRNGQNRMSGKFNPKEYNNDGNIIQCDLKWIDFTPLLFNALTDNAHCYMMANDKNVRRMLNAAHSAGFKFHNLLPWDKGNATPNRWYMKNCEFTGFFYKGKAFYVNDCGAKQLLYVPQEPYGKHPTPKPVMLMRHYIEQSSKPGQTVLDPFMGSCATGAAAILSERKFIGIELKKKWFDVSCKRIENIIERAQQFKMDV